MAESTGYPELTPDPALAGAERVDDLLNRAEAYMGHPDPLRVNFAAFRAGQAWVLLRRKAADKETYRKRLHLQVADDLVANGVPAPEGAEGAERVKVTKTAAADLARADRRYTDYLDELRALEERRDRAKVLHRCLLQRAHVLAGGDEDLELDTDGGDDDGR